MRMIEIKPDTYVASDKVAYAELTGMGSAFRVKLALTSGGYQLSDRTYDLAQASKVVKEIARFITLASWPETAGTWLYQLPEPVGA